MTTIPSPLQPHRTPPARIAAVRNGGESKLSAILQYNTPLHDFTRARYIRRIMCAERKLGRKRSRGGVIRLAELWRPNELNCMGEKHFFFCWFFFLGVRSFFNGRCLTNYVRTSLVVNKTRGGVPSLASSPGVRTCSPGLPAIFACLPRRITTNFPK